MPDHPVSEVHGLIDRHLRLGGALNAHQQIEHGAGRHEAKSDVGRNETAASHRQQKVRDDEDDVDAEDRRGDNRADLRLHRNDGVHVMVRAVERVYEEEQPESEHRQKVTVDGASACRRNNVVDDGKCQWRDEQPDRVVDPQAAERSATRPGDDFRQEVPHRVGEQREDEAADHIPARDVQRFHAPAEERRHELNRCEDEPDDDQDVNDRRELGPLERLADPGQYKDPAGHHHGEIPEREEPPSQKSARHATAGQDRDRVVQECEEDVTQPTEDDALGVGVADPSPAQPRHAAKEIRKEELDGGDDAECQRRQ